MPEDDARRDGERTEPLARALDELAPQAQDMATGHISHAETGTAQAWAKIVVRMIPVALESAKLAELLVADVATAISGFGAAATRSAEAANEQARKLTWATRILAIATVVLAAATVALFWTTVR